MMSRLLLALVVLLSLSLSVLADPPTFCAPVQVDAFAVTATGSGDAEGALLAVVNGTYPTQRYYTALSAPYANPSIFFRVVLTSNTTAQQNAGTTVGVQFTISLNGLYQNGSSGLPRVYTSGVNGATDIEFFNWLSSPRQAVNNTILLNVTETITATGPVAVDINYCSYIYQIIIQTPIIPPATGGFVTGDPQFVGLRGQSFQVHGVDGAVYNLISDKTMQLNTRFTFLEGPRPCPVMPSTGKVSGACWSHPGSYLSELALKTIGGSKLHVVSGDAATGFSAITLDGKALTVGASAKLSFASTGLTGSVSVDNSHEVTIHAGRFDLVVENIDGFVNLRHVSVPAASWSKLASHGLLGQTWQNKRYSGKIKEIEGEVDDYLIEDDNLFGDAFLYNRFTQ